MFCFFEPTQYHFSRSAARVCQMGFVCCLPSFLRLLLLLVLASLVGLPNKTDDRQPRTLQSAGSPRSERSRANAPPPPSSPSHVSRSTKPPHFVCSQPKKKKIKELVSIDRHLLCLFPLRPRAGSPLKPSPHLGIQRPAETTCKSWHSYTRRTVLFFFFFLALLWSAIIKKERKKEERKAQSVYDGKTGLGLLGQTSMWERDPALIGIALRRPKNLLSFHLVPIRNATENTKA